MYLQTGGSLRTQQGVGNAMHESSRDCLVTYFLAVHVDNPVIPSPATGTAVAGKEKDVAGQMDRVLDQFEPSHATCKSKNPE